MTGTFNRFVEKVTLTPDCWFWRGATDRYGYGQLRISGRLEKAHRFAYECLVGPIPDGLVIDHLCRTPGCVNPEHLEVVTNRENMLRSHLTLAVINAKKTHCRKGHEFTPENTRIRPNGSRACRACSREWCRIWRERRKAEYDPTMRGEA